MIDLIEDRINIHPDTICKGDFFDNVYIPKFFEELDSFKILY